MHIGSWSRSGDAPPVKTGSSPAKLHVATFNAKVSRLAQAHSDFDALAAELEAEESVKSELAEAGAWAAEKLYPGETDTIRTVRLRKGLSQKQLAKLVGTSQPHIANIEKGHVGVMFDTVERLCESLGITPNDFQAMAANQKALSANKEGK